MEKVQEAKAEQAGPLQDQKTEGILKKFGLMVTGKDAVVKSVVLLVIGFAGTVVLSKQAATVLLGITPLILMAAGGYSLITALAGRAAGEDYRQEIETLKAEVERLKKQK